MLWLYCVLVVDIAFFITTRAAIAKVVCLRVCVLVNTITLEPFEISS